MPPRASRSRFGAWLSGHSRLATAVVLVFAALASIGAGVAVGGWSRVCASCPSIAQLYAFQAPRATKILTHDGKLIAELFQQRRTPVTLKDLPAHVPQAFIAIEDRRFYRHDGYDVLGIARAATRGALRGAIAGGGSTITQQLARNMFETQIGYEQRMVRKLKELKVALELERVYSKDQIVEAYINQINFGSGWYGIETASLRYFGKHAQDIDPAEAALLAAIINRPGYYSPFANPDAALSRRNLVLSLMVREGYLSSEEAERWKAAPLPEQAQSSDAAELAPYFVEMVRDELDQRFGSRLYTDGYRIHTTLDLEMQRRAQEAMQHGWERIETLPHYRRPKYAKEAAKGGTSETAYLQGLFVAADPRTGAIRALIGGRDFNDSKFNRAVQARRQPGSVFKPFVYAAALAGGIPASQIYVDEPIYFDQADGSVWSPKNFEGDFKGPMTLRQAMRQSINTIAVKLGTEIGIETVSQYARAMGIETPIPPYPSTAIGAADVIPMQVVQAYSAFANGGVRARPFAILKVEDAVGRVLWQARPDTARVLDPVVAALTRDLMRDVVDRGSGYPVRDPRIGGLPYSIPAAGKTGTTNGGTDVWFAGFTPDIVATVWFGFDRPKTIVGRAAGGIYAAPVFGEFMRAVYAPKEGKPLLPAPADWTMPAGVTTRQVDRTTGKLATEWCPLEDVYTESYMPGTEPNELCDRHGMLGVPYETPDTIRRPIR